MAERSVSGNESPSLALRGSDWSIWVHVDMATGNEQSETFTYEVPFEFEKRRTLELIRQWGEGPRDTPLELNQIESPAIIKNEDRIIVHANAAFRDVIAGGHIAAGGLSESFRRKEDRKVLEQTDQLLVTSVASIETEHVGVVTRGSRTHRYVFRTFKCRLEFLEDSSLRYLELSRPLEPVSEGPIERRRGLSEQLSRFQTLDELDKRICVLYSLGESTKSVAATVGLTTRSVEARRRRVMEIFGFDRPVDIIKLLVRFEVNKLIPPLG